MVRSLALAVALALGTVCVPAHALGLGDIESRSALNQHFDLLGKHIVSCHAKDVAWDVAMQIQFREVTLGVGKLDYSTYLKRLAALPGDVPLMIEHMKGPEEYAKSRDHLFRLGAKIGVSFG